MVGGNRKNLLINSTITDEDDKSSQSYMEILRNDEPNGSEEMGINTIRSCKGDISENLIQSGSTFVVTQVDARE